MPHRGVCCTCQSVHPLRPSNTISPDLTDWAVDPDEDTEGEYILEDHDAWGVHCAGSGGVPQALVSERKEE